MKLSFTLVICILWLISPVQAGKTKTTEGTSNVGSVNIYKLATSLSMNYVVIDPNNNNALDAEETFSIRVTVVNNGPGKAYGVRVRGYSRGSNNVSGELDIEIGMLENGASTSQVLNLVADEFVTDTTIVVSFEATEKYGRSAQPLEVTLETRKLAEPDFQIIDVVIDDDKQGASYGNSNNKIEVGEKIEVNAVVQNLGPGDAWEVQANLTLPNDLQLDSIAEFSLGTLKPGQYKKIKFSFWIPQNYEGNDDLSIGISITQSRTRITRHCSIPLVLYHVDTSDVDINIPEGLTSNPDAIAVIIGNSDYESADMPDVEFAISDAAIMKEYLINTFGYESDNILYHTDVSSAQFIRLFGTRETPNGKLRQFVKPGVSDVFVYYSGHGVPDVETKKGYFVPVDCKEVDIKLLGYSLDLFYDNLAQIEAKSITVVIDACFSGNSHAGMLIKNASPIGIEISDLSIKFQNVAIFTSSTQKEISSWYPDMKHGLFTYYFLKGLQGAADFDGDGTIVAKELQDYVSDNSYGVPYYARKLFNRKQTPLLFGDNEKIVRGEIK